MYLKKNVKDIYLVYDTIQKEKLTGMEFQEKYKKISRVIEKVLSTFEDTKQILKMINSGNIQEKISNESKENIQKISEYVLQLQSDLIPKINELRKQESYLQDNEDDGNREQKQSNEYQKIKKVDMEIQDRGQYLENRRKELEDMHKTAAQIRGTTDVLTKKVAEQGDELNEIEANVDTVNDNVKEAKKETIEAEKLQRVNSKKLCCLILIILFAIGGVTAILISLL